MNKNGCSYKTLIFWSIAILMAIVPLNAQETVRQFRIHGDFVLPFSFEDEIKEIEKPKFDPGYNFGFDFYYNKFGFRASYFYTKYGSLGLDDLDKGFVGYSGAELGVSYLTNSDFYFMIGAKLGNRNYRAPHSKLPDNEYDEKIFIVAPKATIGYMPLPGLLTEVAYSKGKKVNELSLAIGIALGWGDKRVTLKTR